MKFCLQSSGILSDSFKLSKFIQDLQLGFKLLILLILGFTAKAQMESPVFSESTKIAKVESLNPAIVRSRYAHIELDQLKNSELMPELGAELEELHLNLFDNFDLIAIMKQFKLNDLGGFSWYGDVQGEEESQVTIVVRDGTMAGSILTSRIHCQIRCVKEGLHVIEELDKAFSKDGCKTMPVSLDDLSFLSIQRLSSYP